MEKGKSDVFFFLAAMAQTKKRHWHPRKTAAQQT
jgi:hypothetical protein